MSRVIDYLADNKKTMLRNMCNHISHDEPLTIESKTREMVLKALVNMRNNPLKKRP